MAVQKEIAYIINESAIPGYTETNIVNEDKKGRLIAEVILQKANERNRNGRYYPSEELFPQLTCPRIEEIREAGYLRSELGHPLSKELIRQQMIDDSRTCSTILKLWTEGDYIWGRVRGTNNSFGEAFNEDLKDGCKPAWSLRALGIIVKTENGNEVRHPRIITWDQVIYPSHPEAYTRKVLGESTTMDIIEDSQKTHLQKIFESTKMNKNEDLSLFSENGIIIPVTEKNVVDIVTSGSSNLKSIKEMFDFEYDDISVIDQGKKVQLVSKTEGTIIVNIEQQIQNEILNYCAKAYDIIKG